MRAETRRVLDQLGSHVDENAMISSLSIADKQMVEIAKAISRDARVVFMDEPTAVLSREETSFLFRAGAQAARPGHELRLRIAQAR